MARNVAQIVRRSDRTAYVNQPLHTHHHHAGIGGAADSLQLDVSRPV